MSKLRNVGREQNAKESRSEASHECNQTDADDNIEHHQTMDDPLDLQYSTTSIPFSDPWTCHTTQSSHQRSRYGCQVAQGSKGSKLIGAVEMLQHYSRSV